MCLWCNVINYKTLNIKASTISTTINISLILNSLVFKPDKNYGTVIQSIKLEVHYENNN